MRLARLLMELEAQAHDHQKLPASCQTIQAERKFHGARHSSPSLDREGGAGARLMMLVHQDDAQREYAYGPGGGLPDTHVGTFSEALLTEANKNGWIAISMKNDSKRIFSFEQ